MGLPNLQGLTLARTLQRAERTGTGTDGAFYRLGYGPGEPHLQRLDLMPDLPPRPGHRQSLLHFVYMTDMHIVDAESPGRFEFVDRFHGLGPLDLLLPTYRPQEFLQLHACAAMLATIDALPESPVTGAAVQFLLCMGDQVDNAQFNELRWFLSLMEGQQITPFSGGATYEGVASTAWNDPAYWHPGDYSDAYKARWGFPTYVDVQDAALAPFRSPGTRLPWFTCHGNHDAFIQGTAPSNPAWNRIVTGSQKARAIAGAFDLSALPKGSEAVADLLDLFVEHPEVYLAGPSTNVTPDPTRRVYRRQEFVQAHLQAGGSPQGHGFTAENLTGDTAYYVDDRHPLVRRIVLDTVNGSGDYFGSIGAAQLAWLEQRLIEAHARYVDVDGWTAETGNTDRLVVICSHHGLSTLTNDRSNPARENDLPRVLGPALESCLHRFPNVILWVNGHTHRNRVRPRPDPSGTTAGFWEVTTSSLLDWPCQARLVEIIANDNGTLSVLCTMVDHVAPADPASAEGLLRLAAIHRELAANDPYAGVASGNQGEPTDRNVELVLPAPFPLD